MANKEAIAIVLDVGPSMVQTPPGVSSALDTAIEGINMILQRKMFSEAKDEVALILFGCADTENPLSDGDTYQNIVLKRPLGVPDFDLLETVQNDLQPSDSPGDFLDALVVAMDHLETGLQGKKGFGTRRLILFSDLGGPFADQELETIVGAIQKTGTELNVIGPNLDDEDEGDQKPADGARADGGGQGQGHRKQKSAQQKAGEALLKHMLDQVTGECYSFSEALPALSYFQSRQVKPMAWKVNLEIGSVAIPVAGYSRLKEFKLKQSWKKVYAQDTSVTPGTLRTYHMKDEEETEVDKEDLVEGYRYGNTLVPMSSDDKDAMKYRAEKCLKVLGFTKIDNFKRQHLLGDGVLSIQAQKDDQAAAVALSSLINALYETNSVAIARRVYSAASGPKLGCLFPHIKAKYECLFWVELPYAEDIRTFTFGSLPLTEDSPAHKKFHPTDDQLACMDDLITNMDLTQALVDEDGDREEALKPKVTFNPYFQRVYQCLQHRALNPDDPIPELSPIVAAYLTPPEELVDAAGPVLERMQKAFKLEVTETKKAGQTGGDMFKESQDDGPLAKKIKLDDGDLAGGLKGMTKAEITEVGSVTPTADFKVLISRKDKDFWDEACQQMQARVKQIVMDSFGQQFYPKAIDCLRLLRQECINKAEPEVFNSFLAKFKDTLIGKGRRDFLELIVKEKQILISKIESEESRVTKHQAEAFGSEVNGDEGAADDFDDETTDDLLMEM